MFWEIIPAPTLSNRCTGASIWYTLPTLAKDYCAVSPSGELATNESPGTRPGNNSMVIWTIFVLSALAFPLRETQQLYNSFSQAKFLLTSGEKMYLFQSLSPVVGTHENSE